MTLAAQQEALRKRAAYVGHCAAAQIKRRAEPPLVEAPRQPALQQAVGVAV